MSVPRPPTAPAPSGRFSSGNRPQFDDRGRGPRHQSQIPTINDTGNRHNPNARSNFGPGQPQRPQSYHPQIHQESLPRPGVSLGSGRASVGRSFPTEMGPGVGQRVNPTALNNPHPPITRYVCFQKKSNNRPWKSDWETCEHITMSIGPEETEKLIRRHDEPKRDIGTCISKLGKYQLRHLRRYEDRLNSSEKDPKNFKWTISAVGKEKKPGGSASHTFWAIYSRQPKRLRPTTAPGRASIPRPQTSKHPSEPTPRHGQQYDGPIVVQSVEIPPPPRPTSFSGGRPATAGGYTSGQYFQSDFMPEVFAAPAHMGQPGTGFDPLGSQSHNVSPVHQPFPQFPDPGPQIREVDSGPRHPKSFLQFQAPRPADSFARSTRAPPAVDAQNFGYQQPHSAEPRASIPTFSIHRPQSNRVDQPFQPEIKRSPRHADVPAVKQQYQRTPPPPQDQRRKRSSSLAAPRVRQERPDSYHQDHVDTRKNRRSTLELPDFSEDKMDRVGRWVGSSMSGSSGLGTSTLGSGDGGSVVGEYVLAPPPMGRRRNSISTYGEPDYYQMSSASGLTRGRSINEGARNHRSVASDYYTDPKPVRRATTSYELQYTENPRGRPSPQYVGYHGAGRKRSVSRKRSRSRHHGAREGHNFDSDDYEYESADEMKEAARNLHLNSSTSHRGLSRFQYNRYN